MYILENEIIKTHLWDTYKILMRLPWGLQLGVCKHLQFYYNLLINFSQKCNKRI